jgi:hypothetical protein
MATIALARFVVSRACPLIDDANARGGGRRNAQRDVRVDLRHPGFRMIVFTVNECRSPAESNTLKQRSTAFAAALDPWSKETS